MATPLTYTPPAWARWLHGAPHLSLSLGAAPRDFAPGQGAYQQALVVLAGAVVACLALNVLLLLLYLCCLCCSRAGVGGAPKQRSSSGSRVAWATGSAALLAGVAVGLGFYGNGEANDGAQRFCHALSSANGTLHTANSLVLSTHGSVGGAVMQEMERLGEVFGGRRDLLSHLDAVRGHALTLTAALPSLPTGGVFSPAGGPGSPFLPLGGGADPAIGAPLPSLQQLSEATAEFEGYRWPGTLLLLLAQLFSCLLVLLGIATRAPCLLISLTVFASLSLLLCWASLAFELALGVGVADFCVAPDQFIVNVSRQDRASKELLDYYLYCPPGVGNPLQQDLTASQKALSAAQGEVQGLLAASARDFPSARRQVLNLQGELNGTETQLHLLTALLDCRGLHKDYVEGLHGLCRDGLWGLLLLALGSVLAALAFNAVVCAAPRSWHRAGSSLPSKLSWGDEFSPDASPSPPVPSAPCDSEYATPSAGPRDCDDYDDDGDDEVCAGARGDPFNPRASRRRGPGPGGGPAPLRTTFPGLYSFPGGSLGSLGSARPPSQSVTNAPISEYMNQSAAFGNPRYENVPLIGRHSPPPSYSPPGGPDSSTPVTTRGSMRHQVPRTALT
uniref:Protein tweety homolog n=1 Tax=Petromyzon marinus TaxID=7757 RepID=A0AAJ7TS81_PETMA|nr:protein tweety homolog 2-like isoform X1 [Petromyzon marinus]XP_032823104.1 protein tweety homolog 2-like isoform X1 [Petromyzon marinus]